MSSFRAWTADPGIELGPRRSPAIVLVTALGLVAVLVLATLSLPAPGSGTRGSRRGLSRSATLVPASLAPVASVAIGARDDSFWSVRHGTSLAARGGGGIDSTFSTSGVDLHVARGSVELSLVGVGLGRRLSPVAAVSPAGAANQVLYRRGPLTESYHNGPYGLEQDFTLQRRPHGSGSLVLSMRLGGSLQPRQAGSEILFGRSTRSTTVRYGQLRVIDADGTAVPARMELRGRMLMLRVDDVRAHYPLRIDPFIASGNVLSSPSYSGSAGRLALSADGNTALVRVSQNNEEDAVLVFARSGEEWSQQGPALMPGGATCVSGSPFGQSLALSASGDTALVSRPCDEKGAGAVWVYTRSGSTWTQQGPKLTVTGEEGTYTSLGEGVALSADGDTALLSSQIGARVFTRSGSTWTQQSRISYKGPGMRVALSAEGTTALLSNENSARVFTRTGETWTQQGPVLHGPGTAEKDGEVEYFGSTIALSGDGNTALISYNPGACLRGGCRRVQMFVRSGGTWIEEGHPLEGTPPSEPEEFAKSIALSSNGDIALISQPGSEENGKVWEFVRSGSQWTRIEPFLAPPEGKHEAGFGDAVALTSDGKTGLISTAKGEQAAVFIDAPSAPKATSKAASAVTQTSATLSATVNPNGSEVTTCEFEYGTTTTYTNSVPCSPSPGSGEAAVAVTASIGSLHPNTPYHFRVVATNAEGTSYGSDETLQTLGYSRPTVVTGDASSITQSSATLNATVNPNGSTVTGCQFEYGTSPSSYSSVVACGSGPGSGSSPVAVSAPAAGLSQGTTYHFRIVATNQGDTSYGVDHTFTTLRSSPTVTSVAPDAGLESGGTSVTIRGTGLSGATAVEFGARNAMHFTVDSATEITATSSAGAGTVYVTVSNSGSTSTTGPASQYTYVAPGPAPTVTKLAPKAGPADGGTSVTISGTRFLGVTAVEFGSNNAASYEVRSATSIVAVSPAGTTGTLEVHVTTPDGESGVTGKDRFTYGAPTVTSVSPGTGSKLGETPVTITGSGFAPGKAATVFKFGKGLATKVECVSTMECTMLSPAAAKSGLVDVSAKAGGKTSKTNPPADHYTYD